MLFNLGHCFLWLCWFLPASQTFEGLLKRLHFIVQFVPVVTAWPNPQFMKLKWQNSGLQGKTRGGGCRACKTHTLTLAFPILCHGFLHQYQLFREQLSSLNKTPLCQYAAAASEMPYSDAWPSVGGCGLQPQDRGVMFFKGTHLTYL